MNQQLAAEALRPIDALLAEYDALPENQRSLIQMGAERSKELQAE